MKAKDYLIKYHAMYCGLMEDQDYMIVRGISSDDSTEYAISKLIRKGYTQIKILSCEEL